MSSLPSTASSVLDYTAHGSPIGFTFYRGDDFPAEYQNDAFIAFHGSWNRVPASGHEIVRVRFDEHGQPSQFQSFVSGFLLGEGTHEFGRPAGLVVDQRGALLFSDDDNGLIYRVHYVGGDSP